MTNFNFEGDTSNITERQLQYINEVIEELGYKNCKVTFQPVGKAGDNYVACVKRIIVEGENASLKMIAKIAPSNELQRKLMSTFTMFANEHTMYDEVLPKLVQLQKDANIPEEEQLKYAKCYGSLMEVPSEVILLEDLNTLKYTMLDRFKPLSNDSIRSVLKNFASLHSLSYVLKNKEPKKYNDFKSNLIDGWAAQAQSEEMKFFFKTMEEDVLTYLDDTEHINFVKNTLAYSPQTALDLAEEDADSKYSVIVQGDAWTNNIMFRFEDDTSPQSIMIDYQMSKNGSPVYDLMYMIFSTCTDYESRHQHFYDWIDYYHSELEKSLSNFDLKVDIVYPREQLDTDLKRYAKFAFGQATALTSLLIRKTEDAAKVQEAMKSDNPLDQVTSLSISSLDLESRTLFKTKFIGLITSFIEFELI